MPWQWECRCGGWMWPPQTPWPWCRWLQSAQGWPPMESSTLIWQWGLERSPCDSHWAANQSDTSCMCRCQPGTDSHRSAHSASSKGYPSQSSCAHQVDRADCKLRKGSYGCRRATASTGPKRKGEGFEEYKALSTSNGGKKERLWYFIDPKRCPGT